MNKLVSVASKTHLVYFSNAHRHILGNASVEVKSVGSGVRQNWVQVPTPLLRRVGLTQLCQGLK